ncbi:hypothetical protein DPMN_040319 [Dreissena polymorpha]|uniref:Uncharacterized protein n=1 Tax=Dreissena polymorpha TaxID=45954 RepID=A0A9D4CWY6_DREPO|nr:hypothetical protein DPMN_040319 [Dreissena polymorpha]
MDACEMLQNVTDSVLYMHVNTFPHVIWDSANVSTIKLPVSQVEKNERPVRDSNPGHLAYRASALQTELIGPPHNLSPKVIKFRT